MKKYKVWLHASYPKDKFFIDYDQTLLTETQTIEFKGILEKHIEEEKEKTGKAHPFVDEAKVLRQYAVVEKQGSGEFVYVKDTSPGQNRLGLKPVWVLYKGEKKEISEPAYEGLRARFGRYRTEALTKDEQPSDWMGYLEFECIYDDDPKPELIGEQELIGEKKPAQSSAVSAEEKKGDEPVAKQQQQEVPASGTIYTCPVEGCGKVIKSAIAFDGHVRAKHPEQYEEFKKVLWGKSKGEAAEGKAAKS